MAETSPRDTRDCTTLVPWRRSLLRHAGYEAATRVRRRSWQHHEVVVDEERWLAVPDAAAEPGVRAGQAALLDAIRGLIETSLTPHQREVLLALAVQEIPIDVLAERRRTT